jgi:hypothetical protein
MGFTNFMSVVLQICVLIVGGFFLGNCFAISQTAQQSMHVRNQSPSSGCSEAAHKANLDEIDKILKRNIPIYREFPHMGFFVYDLTDLANSYISASKGRSEQGCITFREGHVYHFSTLKLAASKSQIAVFEHGKLKVFNSINCKQGKAGLEDVLNYVNNSVNIKKKDDTLTRLKHYRRYGKYESVDQTEYTCGEKQIRPNADKLYSRRTILYRFMEALGYFERNYPNYRIEADRAVGFFVSDLTEPSNKQTSLLERIDFKDGHIYYFADIDLPFSFSNIAILEDGHIRIFRNINCEGKGDRIEELISYLNDKLKHDKNKDEIIQRIISYRRFGVYTSLNGLSTPQCALLRT